MSQTLAAMFTLYRTPAATPADGCEECATLADARADAGVTGLNVPEDWRDANDALRHHLRTVHR